jgi:hypothetical protein
MVSFAERAEGGTPVEVWFQDEIPGGSKEKAAVRHADAFFKCETYDLASRNTRRCASRLLTRKSPTKHRPGTC